MTEIIHERKSINGRKYIRGVGMRRKINVMNSEIFTEDSVFRKTLKNVFKLI
ncbi:MAG: hypothetical protein ABIM42_06700 [candidate division WOR-3 bacterium]